MTTENVSTKRSAHDRHCLIQPLDAARKIKRLDETSASGRAFENAGHPPFEGATRDETGPIPEKRQETGQQGVGRARGPQTSTHPLRRFLNRR